MTTTRVDLVAARCSVLYPPE